MVLPPVGHVQGLVGLRVPPLQKDRFSHLYLHGLECCPCPHTAVAVLPPIQQRIEHPAPSHSLPESDTAEPSRNEPPSACEHQRPYAHRSCTSSSGTVLPLALPGSTPVPGLAPGSAGRVPVLAALVKTRTRCRLALQRNIGNSRQGLTAAVRFTSDGWRNLGCMPIVQVQNHGMSANQPCHRSVVPVPLPFIPRPMRRLLLAGLQRRVESRSCVAHYAAKGLRACSCCVLQHAILHARSVPCCVRLIR